MRLILCSPNQCIKYLKHQEKEREAERKDDSTSPRCQTQDRAMGRVLQFRENSATVQGMRDRNIHVFMHTGMTGI